MPWLLSSNARLWCPTAKLRMLYFSLTGDHDQFMYWDQYEPGQNSWLNAFSLWKMSFLPFLYQSYSYLWERGEESWNIPIMSHPCRSSRAAGFPTSNSRGRDSLALQLCSVWDPDPLSESLLIVSSGLWTVCLLGWWIAFVVAPRQQGSL